MTEQEIDALPEAERQIEYRRLERQCVYLKWSAFAFIALCWAYFIWKGAR